MKRTNRKQRRQTVAVPADIRPDAEESAACHDGNGHVYRKGTTVQCWYDHDVRGNKFDNVNPAAARTLFGGCGRETWVFPDVHQAERSFSEIKNGD